MSKLEIYDKLFNDLVEKNIVVKEKVEPWCYALREIDEAVEKIRNDVISKIVSCDKGDLEKLEELIWEIAEEYKHIQYHINDGKLLEYVKLNKS